MVQMCKPNYRRKLGITSDMNLILLLIFNQTWLALSTEFLALLYFDHVIIYQASNMCIFLITDMALNCLGLIAIIMVLLCFCLDIRSLAWSYSYITPGIVSSRINANGPDTKFLTEVAGIVFTRGPVVAVLILLESNGQTYAVLTEQVRVPVGKFLLELPVGMLDNEKGDFVGTAVREGGCDEEIGLFLYRGPVDEETIRSLQGKETGLRDHGGLIKLRVVPYNQMWRSTADTKALCAIALYEMAKWEGLLPSPSSNL